MSGLDGKLGDIILTEKYKKPQALKLGGLIADICSVLGNADLMNHFVKGRTASYKQGLVGWFSFKKTWIPSISFLEKLKGLILFSEITSSLMIPYIFMVSYRVK